MSSDRSNIKIGGNTVQGANAGTGEGNVFIDKINGSTLRFRRIKEGANISIIQDGDDIIISGASGGGGGTVTSIQTNNGISGGTITTTGTVGLTGQASALHNLSTNGLIVRTGANTVNARTISGGTAISVTNGDGVSNNPVIALSNTAVTPGQYGSATHVGQFTVDAQGRITAASSVEITGGGGGGSTTFIGLTDTPANYSGSANCYVRVNGGGSALEFVNPPSGAPAGSDGTMQYNNNGDFGGATMFYDNSTQTFILGTQGTGNASPDIYFTYQKDGCYTTDSFCFADLGFYQIDGDEYRSFMLIGVEDRSAFICSSTWGESITIKSEYDIYLCGGFGVTTCGPYSDINTTCIGFYGTQPKVKPTITGSRGGNAALASLLTALSNLGLITNSTTA